MPQSKIEYTVLLSSPSDLPTEREAAADIVKEVASSWGSLNGATIRLLSWENVSPGFGTEAQAVINKELGNSWDIYLGLMNVRFGTKTANYGSGTEEEFAIAYDLWEKNPDNRALMFYFKNGLIAPNSIDLEQLGKVREFKKKLAKKGGLYQEFTDTEMFKNTFRANLTATLASLHHQHTKSKKPTNNNEDPPSSDQTSTQIASVELMDKENESGPGFLDFSETAITNLNGMTESISSIAEIMTKATGDLEASQSELDIASNAGDMGGIRKAVDKISKNMIHMAKNLADNRREYSTISKSALDSLSQAISLAISETPAFIGDQSVLLKNVVTAFNNIEEFINTLHRVERSMNSIPNLSKSFSSARFVLGKEFSYLRAELNNTLISLRELKSMLGN